MAKDKDKILANAQKLIQKGQLDKAIKEYQKALEEDRKDVRIHLKLGDLYAKRKETDNAIKAYSEAAKYYTKDGFYSKAVAVYKQALGIDDTRVDLYLSLADLYHKLGLVNDAMTQFHTVIACYEREGKIKEALDTLKRMVDMDPKNVILVTKLAELYYKNGMKPEGYQAFRQALEQLKEENRFEEYSRLLEKLAKSDPENLQNLKELSAIYIRRQVWDRAYQVLGRIYKADPDDLDNLNNAAQVAIRLNQNEQAVELLKALAGKYRHKGLNQKAADALRKVLQIKPDDPDARRALGPEAVAAAKAEAAEEPGEPELLEEEVGGDLEALEEEHEAEVTIEVEKGDEAEEHVQLSADQVLEHLTEADVYLKYGLKDKALHHINVVLKSDPENVKALIRLKDLHVEAGETQKAIELLLKVAEISHKHKDVNTARPALDQLLELDPKNTRALELRQTLAKAAPPPATVAARAKLAAVAEAAEDDTALAVDLELEEPIEEEAPAQPAPPPAPKPAPRPAVAAKPVTAAPAKPEPKAPPKPAPVAKAAPRPAPAAGAKDFSEELEEAEFYLQQGLDDEARKAYLEILKQNPNHTLTLRKLQELEERLGKAADLEIEEEVVQEGPTPAYTEEPITELVEEEEEKEVLAEAAEAKAPKPPKKIEKPKPAPAAPVFRPVDPEAMEVEAEEIIEEEEEAPIEIELEAEVEEIPQAPEPELPAPPPQAAEPAPEPAPIAAAAEEATAAEAPEPETAPAPPADEVSQFIPPVLAAAEDSLFGGPGSSEEGMFNLAAELEHEDLGEVSSEISRLGTSAQFGFEDMFRAFKKGVANIVSPEESSAHYDLGFAYKEMGLIDDAIGEFQTAMSGSSSASNCLLMIGLCQVDRGQWAEAIVCLRQALQLEGLGEHEAVGLYFELGKIYRQSEDLPRARWAFEQAQGIDPSFQDVAEQLAALADVAAQPPVIEAAEEGAAPTTEEAAEAEPAPEPSVTPGPAKEEGSRETAALSEPEAREAEPEPMKQVQKKSRKISYV